MSGKELNVVDLALSQYPTASCNDNPKFKLPSLVAV